MIRWFFNSSSAVLILTQFLRSDLVTGGLQFEFQLNSEVLLLSSATEGHVRSMTMSATRYSTAFAHVVAAGASLWAFRGAGISHFSVGSFGIFLFNSAIGIVTFGNPEFGSKLKGVYGHTLFLSKCFGLPCIATQICLNYGIQKEVAYLHLGFTALPIIAHLFKDRSKKNLLDGVIFSNLISVAYFSYVNANYYGIAMFVSYSVNHFMIGTDGTAFDTSIPSLDLFMYGLSFFNFFAIKTLSD